MMNQIDLNQQNKNNIYNIMVTSHFQEFFNNLMIEYFSFSNSFNEYTIFIVIPDKFRIRPSNPIFHYRYIFANDSIGSVSWIGSQRWIFIDLIADHSLIGNLGTGEINLPPSHFSMLSKEILISEKVISSIKYVFIGDIQFQSISRADNILIPIIVLRNHNNFDPWNPEDKDYYIDLELIKKEIQKIFLPHEMVSIVNVMHSLHDHKHIFMSIAKSQKMSTKILMNTEYKYKFIHENYIDSNILLHELENVEV